MIASIVKAKGGLKRIENSLFKNICLDILLSEVPKNKRDRVKEAFFDSIEKVRWPVEVDIDER